MIDSLIILDTPLGNPSRCADNSCIAAFKTTPNVTKDVQGNTRVFPKWNGNSVNSANLENLINHWSMNWAQFKDPVSHTCLASAVVASWSQTQEMCISYFLFHCRIRVGVHLGTSTPAWFDFFKFHDSFQEKNWLTNGFAPPPLR